jgi:DNA topoisomerase-1
MAERPISSEEARQDQAISLPLTRMPPGLRRATPAELAIRRRRNGQGFSYIGPDGKALSARTTLRRLKSLAVPPAYEDVLYAEDPRAHLQAVGRDAAGRASAAA